MPDYLPQIFVDDLAAPASKRRRLDTPYGASVAIEGACNRFECESSAYTTSSPSPHATAEEICEDSLVCYGMISDLEVHAPLQNTASPALPQHLIRFEPPCTIQCGVSDGPAGRLDDYGSGLLRGLAADDELILQLLLSSTPINPITERRQPKDDLQFLGVIIYGPRRRLSDVGDFVDRAGCYLDDPVGCDRNVPYMNPQCLFSLHEQPPMTFALSQPQQLHIDNFERSSLGVLSGFETTVDFELSANPTALRTELKPHQKRALTFLLRRERGLHPNQDGSGIWLRKTSEGRSTYMNIVTDEIRPIPGPLWLGGLLADEMGLGKTLSMIALIASDQDHIPSNDSLMGFAAPATSLHSNLIVVPLSLFNVWESQLRNHVHAGRLRWFMHHGRQRFKIRDEQRPPDIVFTNYQTIESEYRNRASSSDSLFSYHWRRVILDEAHIIRNPNTSTAQAMTALRATSRWAITGTPIQNSLLDFHSLFKFLHFSPYDDPKVFDNDITHIWRSKPVDQAAETLKKLLSCFMIRRTTAVLDLPSREDKLIRVPFSRKEKEHYRQIEQPAIDMLDRTEDGNQTDGPWMSIIQQINKLRLFCNLGVLFLSKPKCFSQPDRISGQASMMNARFSMGGEYCAHCLQPVEASTFGSGLRDTEQPQVYYSACGRFYCASCSEILQYQTLNSCTCMEQSRPCQLCLLTSFLPSPRLTPTNDPAPSAMEWDYSTDISSKVSVLVSQIRSYPQEKHVVFSCWTSSLDMVERALQRDPNRIIPSVRIDGKVHLKSRSHAIHQFHNDPTIQVILVTIACGACGLDLAAASRVHLLEPQWNPSLEDQALARAHRLGQTRPVTTIRYVMEDSFEEHILKVQDRKKLLTTTLLSSGSSLESLRELLQRRKDDQDL